MKRIDPRPFAAVRTLYREAMARRPRRIPGGREALLDWALLQQESFERLSGGEPPVERLWAAAALQFHLLAALWQPEAGQVEAAGQGRTAATALYGEMIRRLVVLGGEDPGFARASTREGWELLAGAFQRLREVVQAGAPGGEILRCCGEYLSYLAFVLKEVQAVSVVGPPATLGG